MSWLVRGGFQLSSHVSISSVLPYATYFNLLDTVRWIRLSLSYPSRELVDDLLRFPALREFALSLKFASPFSTPILISALSRLSTLTSLEFTLMGEHSANSVQTIIKAADMLPRLRYFHFFFFSSNVFFHFRFFPTQIPLPHSNFYTYTPTLPFSDCTPVPSH
jgi:hypothetical protein